MVVFGVILCFVVGFMLLNNNSFATTSEDVVETNFFGNLTYMQTAARISRQEAEKAGCTGAV